MTPADLYALLGGSHLKAAFQNQIHPLRPNRWAAQTHRNNGFIILQQEKPPLWQWCNSGPICHPQIMPQFSRRQVQIRAKGVVFLAFYYTDAGGSATKHRVSLNNIIAFRLLCGSKNIWIKIWYPLNFLQQYDHPYRAQVVGKCAPALFGHLLHEHQVLWD